MFKPGDLILLKSSKYHSHAVGHIFKVGFVYDNYIWIDLGNSLGFLTSPDELELIYEF